MPSNCGVRGGRTCTSPTVKSMRSQRHSTAVWHVLLQGPQSCRSTFGPAALLSASSALLSRLLLWRLQGQALRIGAPINPRRGHAFDQRGAQSLPCVGGCWWLCAVHFLVWAGLGQAEVKQGSNCEHFRKRALPKASTSESEHFRKRALQTASRQSKQSTHASHISESEPFRKLVQQYRASRGNIASRGADGVNHSQLWAVRTNGGLWADWAACLTLTSDVLTLSMSAKYWAPLDPKSLPPTLKTMSIWR